MSRASNRVQVLLDDQDRRSFAHMAEREGLSLSAWLREAGRERLAFQSEKRQFDSVEDLDRFFEACSQRETGAEPDWEDHRRVIDESIRRGRPRT